MTTHRSPESHVLARRQGPRWSSIWLGCDLPTWLRLVTPHARHWMDARWGLLAASGLASVANSLLGIAQATVFALPLRWTQLPRGPLFIIGHWRSGTTVLHHLLTLDTRFMFPSNYVCFAPHHFLLTEWLLRDGFELLAPARRPMDDLPLHSTSPQEDEFALLGLGAPSPYEAIGFLPAGLDIATRLQRVASDRRLSRRWLRKMDWLVRALTWRHRKRLVLKSPTHTFRVPILLEHFPDAQFVLMMREPRATIASTVAMWKSFCRSQSFVALDESQLEESVVKNFAAMQECIGRARRELAPHQLCEVQYESLLSRSPAP